MLGAVRDGVALITWNQDSFAYAESFDETAARYRGLRAGMQVNIVDQDSPGLLVKADVARRQMDAEAVATPTALGGSNQPNDGTASGP